MSAVPPAPGVSREERLTRARAALTTVQQRVGTRERWAPTLPLGEVVAGVLPGGLRTGSVVSVTGSTSLILALMAEASRAGSWVAMVGMPQVGVVAAARRGLDLAKLALIPHPGIHASAVVAACLEGMDVVALGHGLAISDAERRSLTARARERGSVLIVAQEWKEAHAVLAVERSHWQGLGAGDGRLKARQVSVAVTTRGRGAVTRATVALDVDALSPWRPGVRDVDGARPRASGTPETVERGAA